MEIIIRRRDIYVVAVALSMFFSWVAYATYDNNSAREELRNLARAHVDEWFASEPEGTRREDHGHDHGHRHEYLPESEADAYRIAAQLLREAGRVDEALAACEEGLESAKHPLLQSQRRVVERLLTADADSITTP